MKNLNKYIFVLLIWCSSSTMWAQKAWLEPTPVNPADTVTIFINIAECECQKLVGTTQDVYLWTWQPTDPGTSVLGTWNSSSETMKMTKEDALGTDVYSYKLVPNTFYPNFTEDDLYIKGFSFLAKNKDGGGGGSCEAEFKTEDLNIIPDKPASPLIKVGCFPAAHVDENGVLTQDVYVSQNDFFTVVYDNKLEAKPSLQSLDGEDMTAFAKANLTDGTSIQIAPLTQASNFPELKMRYDGNGIYLFTIIPKKLFNLSPGQVIDNMVFRVLKTGAINANDVVDGEYTFHLKCP